MLAKTVVVFAILPLAFSQTDAPTGDPTASPTEGPSMYPFYSYGYGSGDQYGQISYLEGTQVSFIDGDYTYDLDFFYDVVQSGSGGTFTLGYFESSIAYSYYSNSDLRVEFSGGSYCDAIDDNRAGVVEFICGSTTAYTVSESSTCYYEITYTNAEFCNLPTGAPTYTPPTGYPSEMPVYTYDDDYYDFGQLAYLRGTSESFFYIDYTYTVNMFTDVTQVGTFGTFTLGYFSGGIVDQGTINGAPAYSFSFYGGSYCDAISNTRSGKVVFQCDTSDSESVAETSTCFYEITIAKIEFCTLPSAPPTFPPSSYVASYDFDVGQLAYLSGSAESFTQSGVDYYVAFFSSVYQYSSTIGYTLGYFSADIQSEGTVNGSPAYSLAFDNGTYCDYGDVTRSGKVKFTCDTSDSSSVTESPDCYYTITLARSSYCALPSAPPTMSPTAAPNVDPTAAPTTSPTEAPTPKPTTSMPSAMPSALPSHTPSPAPTVSPSQIPSAVPSIMPTNAPFHDPTQEPTEGPTDDPTDAPTYTPTEAPTFLYVGNYSSLHGRNYSVFNGDYYYDIALFTTVGQHDISDNQYFLGIFDGWDGEQTFSFDYGDFCSVIGDYRRGSVRLACASAEALTVSESSTCVYEIVLEHPDFCVFPTYAPTGMPSAEPTTSAPTEGPTDAPTYTPTEAPTFLYVGNYSSLHGRNYSVFNGDYYYDIALFTTVGQHDISDNQYFLGIFDGWDGEQTFSFDYGDFCSVIGDYRRGSVRLACASAEALSVSESSTCVYEIVLEHPDFCVFPTYAPTGMPSAEPTTSTPSLVPTQAPSVAPSAVPSFAPSAIPSLAPSAAPSVVPSFVPTTAPSTTTPSKVPTATPSAVPSGAPTATPSAAPTFTPTGLPSATPTVIPTTSTPSLTPSAAPSQLPSAVPSRTPTTIPTVRPTAPTISPTTVRPTGPSARPSVAPSFSPAEFGDYAFLSGTSVTFSNGTSQVLTVNFFSTAFINVTSSGRVTKVFMGSYVRNYGHGLFQYANGVQCYDGVNVAGLFVQLTCAKETSYAAVGTGPCRGNLTLAGPTYCVSPTAVPTRVPTLVPTAAPTAPRDQHLWPISAIKAASVANKTYAAVDVTVVRNSSNAAGFNGYVYCNAFATGRSPVSLVDITKANMYATITSTSVRVTLTGLSPSTSYTVYCTTLSTDGTYLSYDQVMKVRGTISTTCCKSLSVSLQKSAFYEDTTDFTALKVSTTDRPGSNLTITLQLKNEQGLASGSSFYPGTVTWTSSSATTDSTLYFLGGAADTLTLTAVLSGPSATEYALSYPNGRSVSVVSSGTALPPPTVVSAVFSNDGSMVTVTLSAASNKGGYSSEFPCTAVFTFDGASSAKCIWTTTSSIAIYPATTGSTELLEVSSRIAVHAQSVVTAECTKSCERWTTMAAQEVFVAKPESPTTPTVILSAPSSIGGCNSLTLDFSTSYGDAGRDWESVSFVVTDAVGGTSPTALQAWLNANYTVSPPTTIKRDMLSRGAQYSIRLVMCNFLSACGQAIATVTVANSTSLVPLVSIVGSSTVSIKRSATLQVYTDAYTQDCNGALSRSGLLYTWSMMKVATSEIVTVTSASQDPTLFKVSPNTLAVNTQYQVTVTVAVRGSTATTSSASVFVTVNPSDIIATIYGGATKQYQSSQRFFVDASQSYDQDNSNAKGVSSGLSFQWSCTQLLPTFSESCPLTYVSASSGVDKVELTSTNTAVGTTSRVTVRIYDATRSATTYTDVSISASPTSLINVAGASAVLTAVNTDEKFSLYGSLTVHSACTATWTTTDPTALSLSAAALTTLSSPIVAGVPTSFNLLLAEKTLPQRVTLGFVLTCGDASSSISITTNAAPQPGYFTVSPLEGTELSTYFTLTASKWQDSDLPLSYQFGFSAADNTVLTIQSKSIQAYGAAYLPAGTEETNFLITCRATIYDVYSASTVVTSHVTVKQLEESEKLTSIQNLLGNVDAEDVDSTKQAIAVAGTVLNTINCTTPTPCASLHRSSCLYTPKTCGACLTGYIGQEGDANSACVFSDSVGSSDGSCEDDDDCAAGLQTCNLSTSTCKFMSKSCNNDCNGHGSCTAVSILTAEDVEECLLDDLTCEVVCDCEASYDGAACEYSAADLAAKTEIRAQLANALVNLTSVEDIDASSISSWSNSIQSITQNTYELSSDSADAADTVSKFVVNQATSLGLTSYDSLNGILSATDASSSYKVRENNRRRRRRLDTSVSDTEIAQATLAVASGFSTLVSNAMVYGQNESQHVFNNFRMTTAVNALETANISVTVPQSQAESSYGAAATSITLQPASSGSLVAATAMQTSLKLYGTAAVSEQNSNPLRVQLTDTTTGDVPTTLSSIEFVIQNNAAIAAYLTDPTTLNVTTICMDNVIESYTRSCVLSDHTFHHRCNGTAGSLVSYCPAPTPSCRSLDVATGELSAMDDCIVTNYTSSTTTCRCSLTSDARRRRLSALDDSGLADIATVTVYVFDQSETFNAAKDLASAEALKKVLVVILLFSGIWAFAFFLYGYIIVEDYLYHRKHAGIYPERKLKETLHEYIDYIVPIVYTNKPWYIRTMEEIIRHHKYLYSFASHHVTSSKKAKIIMVTQGVTTQTSIMFCLAWLYDLQAPDDDGTCAGHKSESSCLARKTFMDSTQTYCSWDGTAQTCEYADPQFSFTILIYMIILTSLISSVLNIFLMYLFTLLKCPTYEAAAPSILEKEENIGMEKRKRTRAEIKHRLTEKKPPTFFLDRMMEKLTPSFLKKEEKDDDHFDTIVVNRVIPDTISKVHEESLRDINVLVQKTNKLLDTKRSYRQMSLGGASLLNSIEMISESFDGVEIEQKEVMVQIMQQRKHLEVSNDLEVLEEYDEQWGIERADRAGDKNNSTSILGISNRNLSVSSMNSSQGSSLYSIRSDMLTKINKEIKDVTEKAEVMTKEMSFYPERLAGIVILQQFVLDLLGRRTAAAKIFAEKFDLDFEKTKLTTKYHQIVAVILIIAFDLFFVFYAVLRGYVKGRAWQMSFMQACVAQFVLEIIISESIECYWLNVVVPSLARIEMQEVHEKLIKLVDTIFDHDVMLKSGSHDDIVKSNGHILNAPAHLFVSNKLADAYPTLLESYLVRSYETFLPGEVSKCWHTVEQKPRLYQKLLPFLRPQQNSAADSGGGSSNINLAYSIMSRVLAIIILYFYGAVQIFGTLPDAYQKTLIRAIIPAITSFILYIWYWILRTIPSTVIISFFSALFLIYLAYLYNWYYVKRAKDKNNKKDAVEDEIVTPRETRKPHLSPTKSAAVAPVVAVDVEAGDDKFVEMVAYEPLEPIPKEAVTSAEKQNKASSDKKSMEDEKKEQEERDDDEVADFAAAVAARTAGSRDAQQEAVSATASAVVDQVLERSVKAMAHREV